MKKIIIVDDEVQISKLLQTYLEQKLDSSSNKKYDIKVFNGGNPCIEYLKLDGTADLILSDMRMPDGEGIEILNYINSEDKKIPLFFMTGFSGDFNSDDMIAKGAKKVFSKPFKCKDLVSEIETFLNR